MGGLRWRLGLNMNMWILWLCLQPYSLILGFGQVARGSWAPLRGKEGVLASGSGIPLAVADPDPTQLHPPPVSQLGDVTVSIRKG